MAAVHIREYCLPVLPGPRNRWMPKPAAVGLAQSIKLYCSAHGSEISSLSSINNATTDDHITSRNCIDLSGLCQ